MEASPLSGSRFLLIDDDPVVSRLVGHWLSGRGAEVESCGSGAEGLAKLSGFLPDVLLLDIDLPDAHGLELLQTVLQIQPNLPVVMMTSTTDVSTVVGAMQGGAYDYIPKPLDRTKLLTTARNALDKGRSVVRLRHLEREAGPLTPPGFVGRSPEMTQLYRHLDRVGPSNIRVLIQGESGTGKELVARSLHDASPRRNGPFVAINCAAVPESLQESELFGHERGAFTGASQRRMGRLEQAHGGTLFLDEVAELSASLQAQLLRALQEGCFFRVGGDREVRVDVRIVAATHADLSERVAGGQFREDLYYRLAVFELRVPPLRDRAGDVPLLAEHFLGLQRVSAGRLRFSAEAMALLEQYDWPGNVRQLINAVERAALLARDGEITPMDLPPQVRGGLVLEGAGSTRSMNEIEEDAIRRALAASGGNVSEVVRTLGMSRSTLYRRLRQMGLR